MLGAAVLSPASRAQTLLACQLGREVMKTDEHNFGRALLRFRELGCDMGAHARLRSRDPRDRGGGQWLPIGR
jgi:hypothetical protein